MNRSCNNPGKGCAWDECYCSGQCHCECKYTPDMPSIPGPSDFPDQNDFPEFPHFPGEPDVPEFPDEPDVPEFPDFPGEPDVPEFPDFPGEPDTSESPDFPDDPLDTSCGDLCAQLDYYLNQPENYRIEVIMDRGNNRFFITTINTKGFHFTYGFAHVNFPECTFTMLGIPTDRNAVWRFGCHHPSFRLGQIRQVDIDEV